MLDALKKAVGIQEAKEQVAPVEAQQDLTNLGVNEQLQEALNEIITKDAALQELNVKLGDMAKEIEGYKEQLSALQEFAKEAEAKALAAAEEMKAKELADKKAQLAEVIGADNPDFDKTFAALEGLNSEAFSVVLNGFKASFEAEAKSPMFNEVGVSGEAEMKDETESATARILKQTYQNQ